MNLSAKLLSNLSLRISNVVAFLFITVLLTRLMGVEAFGFLSLMIVNLSVFNLFTSLGSDAAISYHTAAKTLAEPKIVSWLIIFTCAQILFFGLLELMVPHFFEKDGMTGYKWIYLIYLFALSISEKYGALLNGKHLYLLVNRVIFFTNAVFLAVLAFFFFQNAVNVANTTYFIFFIVFQFFQAALLTFFYHKKFAIRFRLQLFSRNELRIFFSYSLVAFVTNCIQFLAYRMDFWFVDFYRDDKSLGWYSLASRLVQFFFIASMSYASIIHPYISSVKQQYEKAKFVLLIKFMNLVNLLLGIALFALSRWVIPFLFGSEYSASVLPFQILLPGVLLFCITNVLAAYFSGLNLLKVNLIGSSLCFVLILLLDFLLIPSYGIVGAAITSSIGYSITTLYFITVYCIHNHLKFSSLFLLHKSDLQYAISMIKQSLKPLR